jgi:hypothetical protein
MEINFLVGEVVGIDVFHKTASGVTVPMIKVISFLDGSDVDLPWLPVGTDQKMPLAGQEVLYYTFGGRNFRMVCFHGKNPSYIRKGQFGLNEGEFVVQSDAGLGYLKGSKDGSLELASGDAVTDVLLSDDGMDVVAPEFSLKTYGGASLIISEDGTISLERRSKDDNIVSKVELDAKSNIIIQAKGDVTIKATNILLDGNVKYGPGASDPNQAILFGDVVTAGPGGTHPFDFVTGAPILGSSSVKAAR